MVLPNSFDSALASSLTLLSTRPSTGQATIVQLQDGGSGPALPPLHPPTYALSPLREIFLKHMCSGVPLCSEDEVRASYYIPQVSLILCPRQTPISLVLGTVSLSTIPAHSPEPSPVLPHLVPFPICPLPASLLLDTSFPVRERPQHATLPSRRPGEEGLSLGLWVHRISHKDSFMEEQAPRMRPH